MPLTSKGAEIMENMKSQYGEEKGESVFYASKNAGTISGVDSVANDAAATFEMPTELPSWKLNNTGQSVLGALEKGE